MLSEVFWVSFVSVAAGLILKLASIAYKSKCTECSCWGINIIREVELEMEESDHKTPVIESEESGRKIPVLDTANGCK